MREEPKVGQIYRHFKGNVYEIVAIAKHTESNERLVIYKSGNENATVYARPLEMFLSEVDHEKYKDVEAKYRFTLLDSNKDEVEEQYDEILGCLKMMGRFEGSRLRSRY